MLQDDGFIAKILQEAGAKDLAVGTPLAILVEDSDHIPQFADYSPSGSSTKTEEAAPPAGELLCTEDPPFTVFLSKVAPARPDTERAELESGRLSSL